MIKLKDIYLFQWINEEFTNMIVDNSRRVEFKKWEVIINQWDKSDWAAFIIQKGNVMVEIDWTIINHIWEWNIFWEIALITDEPRTATISATKNIIALKINKTLLEQIIRKFKNWKEIQKTIVERIMMNHNNSK